MQGRRHLTTLERAKFMALYEDGLSFDDIAKKTGYHPRTVRKHIKDELELLQDGRINVLSSKRPRNAAEYLAEHGISVYRKTAMAVLVNRFGMDEGTAAAYYDKWRRAFVMGPFDAKKVKGGF